MQVCRVCGSQNIVFMLDAGLQPVSNRYVANPGEKEDLFPLKFDLCRNCGMMQLAELVPAAELKPRVDWITYNEPEDHLDSMVEMLAGLKGMSADAFFLGVSFKDDTTLRRFENKGFKRTARISPQDDLGITDQGAGAETLQGRITAPWMRKVAAARGKADMVIVRHILEHAHDLRAFLDGLKELLVSGGYVAIEVPDCSRAIARCDYTTLWEEHVVYFSPATLRRCLEEAGFSVVHFEAYPYAFEDSLVCVVTLSKEGTADRKEDVTEALAAAEHFAAGFTGFGGSVRAALETFRRDKGRVAMFGAGHLACVYINFFGLKDVIDFVADDNPHKKGLFMPGSQVPILGSASLVGRNIKLCLLTLNPMGEEKVVGRNTDFTDKGGVFASVFPASRCAFKY